MKNNKKNKTIIFIILSIISLILFSSIVYSAFSSTMHITGTAHARVEANVRITDFRLKSVTDATSSYEDFGKSHITTNIELTSTSSSITYYLEITNYGTVDIGILNITGLPTGVNYSIKDYNLTEKICNDSGKCNGFINKTYELTLTTTSSYSGSVQLNFDFRTYHQVTYTDITNNNYPTEVIDGGNLSITFKEDLKRVQAISNNNEIAYYKQVTANQTITINNITNDVEIKLKEQVARLKNGTLDKAGSQVCIGDECFYIISNDGSTVTMLSKYNLYVGGSYDGSKWTEYGEEATGIQDSTMLGYVSTNSIANGTTPFGTTYLYDESIVKKYIDNYGQYIKTLGVDIINQRLITINELSTFGCSPSEGCPSEYPFIYSTSYWTQDSVMKEFVLYIMGQTTYASALPSDFYKVGVRPVIEIPVEEIRFQVAKLVNGNIGDVGSEICISNECFYTISSDEDSVTMLAKYNLHVGTSIDRAWNVTELANPTGKQEANAIGWFSTFSNANPIIGTRPFASTNYWASTVTSYPAYVYNSNSYIYSYVEDYKTYLRKICVEPIETRLITYEELEALGCKGAELSCLSAPSWVYTTTYWSGSAHSADYIWYVGSDGYFFKDSHSYTAHHCFGVRPVITIPKKTISDTFDFTIDGATYKAEEGMTWTEWVNSKYNKFGNLSFVDIDEYDISHIGYTTEGYSKCSGGAVYSTDVINKNKIYNTYCGMGSND